MNNVCDSLFLIQRLHRNALNNYETWRALLLFGEDFPFLNCFVDVLWPVKSETRLYRHTVFKVSICLLFFFKNSWFSSSCNKPYIQIPKFLLFHPYQPPPLYTNIVYVSVVVCTFLWTYLFVLIIEMLSNQNNQSI